MNITIALELLHLEKLPISKEKIDEAYKKRAKKLHPDVGGTEEGFKELQHAHVFAIKALELVYESKKVNPAEDALKKKRARMREEMLKKRAVEDHKRNVQATRGIIIVVSFIGLILLVSFLLPIINRVVVERNPIEQMATVVYSDRTDKFLVQWNWDGVDYQKSFTGRFVEGRWLVSESGMPVIIGNQYVIRFNANHPSFALLKDEFISPTTAEVYFNIIRHPLSTCLNLPIEDSHVVCMYWGILDQFGVDGLADILFYNTPFRKNWYHNEGAYEELINSEEYQNLYRSCLIQRK